MTQKTKKTTDENRFYNIEGKMIRVRAKADIKVVDQKENKDQGIIEAYVSIFDNVDLMGDIIKRGAFVESLRKKLPKGVWMHNWEEPIAKTLKAEEDAKGLFIRAQFNLETQRGREAFSDIKFGIIDEFSIGFKVLDYEWDENDHRIIKKVRLYEWSPVLAGANPATELVNIKGGETEAKPYPNEHACRLRDPKDFEKGSFRRITRKSKGKEYSVIMGKLKGKDTMTEQSYRYKKTVWTEAQARAHCRDHKGQFEAAGKKSQVDFVDMDYRKKRIKIYYRDGSVKRLKLSYKYIKYLKSLANKGVKVESDADSSGAKTKEKEKILRIRQAIKQADRACEYVLRITK